MKKIKNISAKFEKIDNLVFNPKFLNIVTIAMAALFVFLFIAFSFKANSIDNYYENLYNQMQANLEKYNLNLINNSASSNGSASAEKEQPLFKNGIDAVVSAFELFYAYTSYEVKASGVITSEAVGQNIEIIMNGHFIKFDKDLEYQETRKIETKTNFGQTSASKVVYKNGQKYTCPGSNVQRDDMDLTATYSNNFSKTESSLNSIAFYLINKQTVLSENYYTIKRNPDGSINCYYASVELSPYTSITNYAKEIQEMGKSTLPKFSRISLTCIIDKTGHLISMSTNEFMTLTKNVVIDVTVTTNNKLDYVLISHNETPSIPKPTI